MREYLGSREKEVVDIMMVLYDNEEIMRSYIESEVYEANIETAKRMLIDGELSLDRIAKFSNLPIEVVEELAREL